MAPPFATSDAGVDRGRSSELAPPWPDLVLASGRENEPLARWIKEQSRGRTRIVQVGRPWGPIAAYDLVVTTPQYRLPARPNVLENTAPLHRVTHERLHTAGRQWSDRLAHLPRPLIAVLVGGNSGPYALTRRSGERLAAAASALAARLGGSLLVTTSSRTPRAAARALEEGLTCPHLLYRWRRGDVENPYFAFLAHADEIIVTADSMSMVTEALATRQARASVRPRPGLDLDARPAAGARRAAGGPPALAANGCATSTCRPASIAGCCGWRRHGSPATSGWSTSSWWRPAGPAGSASRCPVPRRHRWTTSPARSPECGR